MLRRLTLGRMTLVALLAGSFNLSRNAFAQAPATAPAMTGAAEMGAMPATMPTSQPIDPASPKGALVKLSAALDGGDAEALSSILLATTPLEEKILGAMAIQAKAFKHFRGEAVKAFGEKNANDLTGDPAKASEDKNSRLSAAEMKIDGDNATIGNGAESLSLKKVNGAWRLPVSSMTKDLEAAQVDDAVDGMKLQSSLLDETADEIAAGKHKDVDTTKQAVEAKMLAAIQKRRAEQAMAQMKEQLGSTTGPTTAPATMPMPEPAGPMQP